MLWVFHEHLSPQRFRFFPPVKVEIDERQVVKSVGIFGKKGAKFFPVT
jgi:hypothetical protein